MIHVETLNFKKSCSLRSFLFLVRQTLTNLILRDIHDLSEMSSSSSEAFNGPTFHGYVESTADALKLMEACERGNFCP